MYLLYSAHHALHASLLFAHIRDRVLSVYLQIFIGLSCGRIFCAAMCNQPCNMPILSINMLDVAMDSVDVQINSIRYFLLEIEQGP